MSGNEPKGHGSYVGTGRGATVQIQHKEPIHPCHGPTVLNVNGSPYHVSVMHIVVRTSQPGGIELLETKSSDPEPV